MTARGGSKGIPGKNLRLLAGKPLIGYTLESAVQSRAFDRLVLSTDASDIADYARRHGCEVPFMRPAELATDETAHLAVLEHTVRWLQEHEAYRPDAVMILQPTSPLRRSEDIRAAIALLERSDADSVVSVSAVPPHANPMRMLKLDAGGRATLFVTGEPVRRRINRRQDMLPAWLMDGAIYLFKTATLFDVEPSLYGDRTIALPLQVPYGISIDDPDDWASAERALASLAAGGPHQQH